MFGRSHERRLPDHKRFCTVLWSWNGAPRRERYSREAREKRQETKLEEHYDVSPGVVKERQDSFKFHVQWVHEGAEVTFVDIEGHEARPRPIRIVDGSIP